MKKQFLAFIALLMVCTLPDAHHGSSISYDTGKLWSTSATVVQFNYMNPHPSMVFERTVENGVVERWVSELLTNPSMMARQGWTKQRVEEGLKSGAHVKLTLATSRAGGFSGIVMMIESADGEPIGGGRASGAIDLDGKAGGLQPKGEIVLPGQENHP